MLKNNIPSLYTVDNAGLYTKEIPFFSNTHIFKADPIVIEKLREQINYLKMINLIIAILIHGDLRRL